MKSDNPDNKDDLVALFNEWAEKAYGWPQGYKPRLDSVWEHGQWWIHDAESGASWAVHDAEWPGTVSGYDFEQVADGDFAAFENEMARQEQEEKEEDPALELLRQIVAADYGDDIWGAVYGDDIWGAVDDCLAAGEGDSEALRLLDSWRKGNADDSIWYEIRELIGGDE